VRPGSGSASASTRKLLGLGRPARFGHGEETLTDRGVRDTWEIPKHLVRAEWNDAVLKVILATVKEELGLPDGTELTADLHSLLVYEPNQFFLTHQDSEKDDSMIGTLVVTLPSGYTGGELMVGLGEEWKAYRGSKTALSLVAFYADCRHEVLKVKSGYRITLTYNLLLHGDTSRPEGEEGTVTKLADLLREHFSTPVPGYYGGPATDPPNRLVYLLDHGTPEETGRASGLLGKALRVADAVTDAKAATMLLRPFRIENLNAGQGPRRSGVAHAERPRPEVRPVRLRGPLRRYGDRERADPPPGRGRGPGSAAPAAWSGPRRISHGL
jgi:hypothetical protein